MNPNYKILIEEINQSKQDSFTKEELISLIKVICLEKTLPRLESNHVVIDPESMTIFYRNTAHIFSRKPFFLLYYLIDNKGKYVSREKILNHVWGSDTLVNLRTIDVQIGKIRSILHSSYIKTRVGLGYCWCEIK